MLNATDKIDRSGALYIVDAHEIERLPQVVRRYFEFMEVVGRPRVFSLSTDPIGRFRTSPTASWSKCEIKQFNSCDAGILRTFRIELIMAKMVPVVARDTYIDGKGEMQAKLFGVCPIATEKGPETDLGELVSYLNDAILMAPSMLLGPQTTWTAVDGDTFDVALEDHGIRVSGRVRLDYRGAPLDFLTNDRFFYDLHAKDRQHRFARRPWSTPVSGWQRFEGRAVPTAARAVWHLDAGEFTYAEIEFPRGSVRFNVP